MKKYIKLQEEQKMKYLQQVLTAISLIDVAYEGNGTENLFNYYECHDGSGYYMCWDDMLNGIPNKAKTIIELIELQISEPFVEFTESDDLVALGWAENVI